jgi:hypothetical protein
MRRRRTSSTSTTAGVDTAQAQTDSSSGGRKPIDISSPSCNYVASSLPNQLIGRRALSGPSRASTSMCFALGPRTFCHCSCCAICSFHFTHLSSLSAIHNDQNHQPAQTQSINQMNKSCTSRNNRRHIHSLLLRPPSLQQHTSNTPFTTLPSPTSIQLRHHAPTVQKIHSSTNQQAIGGIG